MMRTPWVIFPLVLMVVLATPAFVQKSNAYDILSDDYSIMVPEKGAKPKKYEPWLPPKYKSPRGTVKHVTIPKSTIVTPPVTQVPQTPIIVPQTGRALPNLPSVSGSGPGGAETYQDRAARCTHQAGVYGQAAGNRGTYIGTCINQ
ncbi:MAG TPA: hypothetical protein VEH02_03050 [Pseudolabrys sp.]|nr:hypothetical protein [Pseudolabrys sp.]